MTIKTLRWIPTIALAVAFLSMALLYHPGGIRPDVAVIIDRWLTLGWIVGTWGHFVLWHHANKKMASFKPSRAQLDAALEGREDRRPDKITVSGEPVLLPEGWNYTITPRTFEVETTGTLEQRYEAVIHAPNGKDIQTTWRLLPEWLAFGSRNNSFPTKLAAEETVLKEIAARQPLKA